MSTYTIICCVLSFNCAVHQADNFCPTAFFQSRTPGWGDMGSILISDVGTDFTRYPHTMVVGDVPQASSTGSDRIRASSVHSQHSQQAGASYSQRHHSSSATPTQTSTTSTTGSSVTLIRQGPQHTQTEFADRGLAYTRGDEDRDAATAHRDHHERASSQFHEDSDDGFDRSGFPLSHAPRGLTASPPSPRLLPTLRSSLSLNESASGSPNRIKVRDLNHIQSFASEEVLTRSRHGSRHSLMGRQDGGQQYEISAMPVTDIIEMVSGLLTKITTTNDRQHEHIHRHIPPPEGATGLSQQTTSVLAFHGKNVPSITILSYLSRIHKYCPTTYEVFLSLLVYFDRMAEMINCGTLSSFHYSDDHPDAANRHTSSADTSSVSLHTPDHLVVGGIPLNSVFLESNDTR